MRKVRAIFRLVLAGFLGVGCAARSLFPAPGVVGDPARGVVLVMSGTSRGGGERFLGSDACRDCHPRAWNRWMRTAHAGSFTALRGDDDRNPVCLRCHATGYGDPRGYLDFATTPALAGVGCEACHGAGAHHASSRHPELIPTATGGECPPCEINRICRACHTPERSPAFDLARDLGRVACRAEVPR